MSALILAILWVFGAVLCWRGIGRMAAVADRYFLPGWPARVILGGTGGVLGLASLVFLLLALQALGGGR